MSTDDLEPPSHAAGACVLVALGAGALAIVFAVSPTAGVLAVWVLGGAALARVARRRMSDSSATPPPPSGDTVYAGHRDEIERVQEGPGEGMLILYPVREPAATTPTNTRG